ncbi:MAG TPA: OmpA family protein [Candidatus Tectomicrobia bacterium]|nr:OmpA family protein [Candidatus Tectomicrobia bacterium]
MADSPTNGTSTDTSKPQASDGDVLDELRSLIVGPEQTQLRRLQERLDSFTLRADTVGHVLPEAIHLRSRQDRQLTNALLDTVEEALHTSVRKNPRVLLDILFPLIGPAIRKAIASALRTMIDSLNHSLDVSISLQGVKWRLEAIRTGKPFAEVVLLHTLRYRVEQVFLIHRDNGLLLLHGAAKTITPLDGDLISGMLTAIQDFIRDSFGAQGSEGLATVQMGDLTIWIEQGPQAIVAAVVWGIGPSDLQTVFQEAVEAIHLEQREQLEDFQGDVAPFESSRHHLEACLLEQYESRERRTSPILWIVCAVILSALGFWVASWLEERQRWTSLLATLRAEPGIVLTTAEKQGGKYVLSGLRDPLAVDPQHVLQQAQLDLARVSSRWEPYHALHPAFVFRRANALLAPPDTVRLSLADGVLQATGTASHGWIVEAERLAPLIPGVLEFRRDQLVDTTLAELAAVKRQIEQVSLHFRQGTTQFSAAEEEAFKRLSAAMLRLSELAQAAHAHLHIDILGHADTTGREAKNLLLSQARAERVLADLVAQGLAGAILSATGVNTKLPHLHEVTDEDRAMNRRVSFRVNITGIAM